MQQGTSHPEQLSMMTNEEKMITRTVQIYDSIPLWHVEVTTESIMCGVVSVALLKCSCSAVHHILSCPSVANVYWTDAMTRVPSCMLIKISSAG